MAFKISREDRWRIKREIAAYCRTFFLGNPKSHRILIFAQGRTGSTLLESLLESTGYFLGKGEVLGALNEKVYWPIGYINGIARQFSDQNIVCHVKIYQLGRDRIEHGARPVDTKTFLHSMDRQGWHIIALRRENKFDHYISGCLARARGSYHKLDDREEDVKLSIDRMELQKGILNRTALDQQEEAALEGIAHTALTYERNLSTAEQQKSTIAELLEALGLEPRPVSTKLKKIASRPKSEIIKNYEEARGWANNLTT